MVHCPCSTFSYYYSSLTNTSGTVRCTFYINKKKIMTDTWVKDFICSCLLLVHLLSKGTLAWIPRILSSLYWLWITRRYMGSSVNRLIAPRELFLLYVSVDKLKHFHLHRQNRYGSWSQMMEKQIWGAKEPSFIYVGNNKLNFCLASLYAKRA